MRISAKGKYALRMLVDLAENGSEEYVSLSEISQRQNISKKFLEQIVPMLVKNGIISANRGNHGGYKMRMAADRCFVGEVLRATEGELIILDPADNEADRKIAFVFEGMQNTLKQYADNISIQDIVNHQSDSYDYYI